jgi:hypothetical protein
MGFVFYPNAKGFRFILEIVLGGIDEGFSCQK